MVEAESVIIATALRQVVECTWRSQAQRPRGFGCAATGFLQKMIAVVGGRYRNGRSKFSDQVCQVGNGDRARRCVAASKIMQERTMKNPKISFLWNAEVREVLGDEKISV